MNHLGVAPDHEHGSVLMKVMEVVYCIDYTLNEVGKTGEAKTYR